MNPERHEPKGPATLDEANRRLQRKDGQIDALSDALAAASLVIEGLRRDFVRILPSSLVTHVTVPTTEELISAALITVREGRR